ncbi:rhodanese-like domain-containing protein [Caenimonas terrae]|uniref:Rhodanese-like domain-containing protein n=1 Tax=Caenimonas terrae TaxID=696074 RepID=A0ABW0NED3_9BURK
MNFIVENWMIIAVAVASGAMLLWPLVKGATGGALSTAGAVQLINRERGVVIDVSEPEEFAAGHVGGAKSVPLGQLEQRLPEVVKNKALPVILVCASGGRAVRAEGIARKLGYEKAQAMAGGLKSWKEANLPIEKA